jgi:sulfhydrogenase subunit beta (sulfur reductase)
MYIIDKNIILDIANEISKAYDLYGPFIESGTKQVFFDKIEDPADIDLKAPIPSMPVKHIIFPQIEDIISYNYNKTDKQVKIKAEYDDRPKALFGIRSCDLNGILCLDRFFLGQEFVDEFYRNHRKKMFIIANTCVRPFTQCFCVCTDSGPAPNEGYDLNLTELDSHYLIETGSAKGEEFISRFSLKKASKDDLKEKEFRINESISMFDNIAVESKAWISRVVNRVTTGFIKEEVWEYIGNQCFECGACSFVCPTCSCFNIADICTNEDNYKRLRSWDSCSYEGYSRMAGGYNPRKPVEDRRNKRFFCKLSFSQSKKYLRPGCVGCGRCSKVCPGDIGMPNVVQYIRRNTTGYDVV